MIRLAVAVLAVLALAGCGSGGGHGTATLWVTRDRGAHVLFTGKVPAGLTAMQALERVQHVTTRYGGRYVQSIDGVSGSLSSRHDWFYFVNGIEAGRGAAEVRLHRGDVEWWDYRKWPPMSVPVVVGAWPKPVAGNATVVGTSAGARALRHALRATGGAYRVVVTQRPVVFHVTSAHGRVTFVISERDALRLARHPSLARFHYQGLS